MQKKISFDLAKKTLAEAKLLIASNVQNPSREGYPQHKTEELSECDIFIAIQGQNTDAHDLLEVARTRGARLLIISNREKLNTTLTKADTEADWIQVRDTRAAWTVLIALAHGNPQDKFSFYGVTGTDGKTSTVWIASQLIRRHHLKCLSLGTLGAYDGNTHWSINHTTPDPPILFSTLADGLEKSISKLVMEVSSHSLMQEKVYNLSFSAAAWTSFSRDHLDFHKTMKDYWDAKCQLFERHLKPDGRAIVNHRLIAEFPVDALKTKDLWTYGFDPLQKQQRDRHVALLEYRPDGTRGQYIRFAVRGKIYEGSIPYLGLHNAENFIAAWLIAETALSYPPSSESWATLDPIPGRCELINTNANGPRVFVDFAHTPNALKTILSTLRDHSNGSLWVVFGCGGNRDRGKRPEMAAVAEALADHLILTSDNPRNEDPFSILNEMRVGLKASTQAKVELDRRKAIELAISSAEANDTILIAGKGHEAEQIIGDKKFPFSDQDTARHYLKLRS